MCRNLNKKEIYSVELRKSIAEQILFAFMANSVSFMTMCGQGIGCIAICFWIDMKAGNKIYYTWVKIR